MGTILQDLRFGARSLKRQPGSAAISVVILAMGIGLCSFMFSLVFGIYGRGLNIPENERVFIVRATNLEQNQLSRNVSIQDFHDWRQQQTSFEGLIGHRGGITVNISGPDGPRRFSGARVTANTFDVLRVPPMLGRGFAEGEDVSGAPPNVVLGFKAWRDAFGQDASVVGREVRVNGEPATIIGVMPDGFEWPRNTEVWIPLRVDPLATERGQGTFVTVTGRLADGSTKDQAEAEMARIALQLERDYPASNEGIGTRLETHVEANMNPQLSLVFTAMMVAVLLVLLVACANVANLLLGRAQMRTKEASIRLAMGAGRIRVMIPFFAEALILAGIGALIGVGIAYVGIEWFDTVTDPARTGRPWFMRFTLDLPILLFVIGVSVLTALAAGLAPAFQMSRTDVNAVLKDEARGSTGLKAGKITRILVTAEVALSCALLVGAGLMTKSIVNIGQTEYIYPTDELFTARAGLFQTDYPDREGRQALWRDLEAEIEALPQVASVGLGSSLPFGGGAQRSISIDGVEYGDASDRPTLNRVVVTPSYFEALGVEVIQGRPLGLQDDTESELVAVVNAPMVERYFDGQNPVGRQFREGASDTLPLITIVGVVPDLQIQGSFVGFPGFEPGGYYVPLLQNDPSFMTLTVMPRAGLGMGVTSDVRTAVRRVDPDLPIYNVWSQAEVIDRAIWFYSVFGTVFIGFGLAALFMASAGLYGVLSFAVSRRTQEMGIRMALGASARDVIGLVALQGAKQLGIGLLLGLGLAFGLTRIIGLLMYEVDPQDPMVFATVFGTIILVGAAAAVFPARRATSVDPVVALQYD